MILVDSSVWIDYFRGVKSPQAERLDSLLRVQPVSIGDLILTEVLQGCATEAEFNRVKRVLLSLDVVELGGLDIALQAARNYRFLRGLGITVRKTIDVVIATYCIENGYLLLHNDRDFLPFVEHLGLTALSD
jgi:predicted nucleic acid-binding protein